MGAVVERRLRQRGRIAGRRLGWRAACLAAAAVAALALAPTDAKAGRFHFGFGLGFGGPYYYPYPYYPYGYYRPYAYRHWYRRHDWPYAYSRYGWPYWYGYPPYYDPWYEERRRREAEDYRQQRDADAAARYAAYQWFFSPHPYWLGGRLYWHVPPGVPDDIAALPEPPEPEGPADTDVDPGSAYYPSYHPLYREEHR